LLGGASSRAFAASPPRRCRERRISTSPLALKNLEPERIREEKERKAQMEERSKNILNSSISIYNYNVSNVMKQLSNVKSAAWKGAAETKRRKGKGMSTNLNIDKLAYQYYNWRSSTANDIIVFMSLVGAFIFGAGALNYAIKHVDLFTSVYQVMQLFFQDGFPDPDDMDEESEVYAIFVATAGLVFFTILLAMVEQFFMEVLETNVQRGSRVYEKGHVLVLSWMESALCRNAVARILKETCAAYRYEGGIRIVVLCDKPKLEMEALYERVVPEVDRHGSKIIFRQGPPMIPEYLEMVAAKTARSTIIVSDASRAAHEADAQALRTAVFLDEMFSKEEAAVRGMIVVELKTGASAQLLRQACSEFVIPLSTYNLNNIRLAGLAQRPVSGFITAAQCDFMGSGQQMVKCFPELTGVRYRDLKFFFPDATVVGLLNVACKTCKWDPVDAVVKPGDEIMFMKGIDSSWDNFKPLPVPVRPDMTSAWVDVVSRGSFEDRLAVFETESPFGMTVDAFDEEYFKYMNSDAYDSTDDDLSEALSKSSSGNGASGPSSSDLIPGIVSEILTNIDPSSWSMDEDDEAAVEDGADEDTGLPLSMMTDSMYEDGLEFSMIGTAEDQKIRKTEKVKVLIIGWAEDDFMTGAIMEMDEGLAAMPQGTEITLFNQHLAEYEEEDGPDAPPPGLRNSFLRGITSRLQRVSLDYLHGDPLNAAQMQEIPLEEYNTVIILCDKQWMDADLDPSNGIDSRSYSDMLRMDALVMTTHVTLNMLLAKKDRKNAVKIITEKVSLEGTTRFENPLMLPLGFTFNRKDFAASLLAHIAFEPKIVPILAAAAQTNIVELQDPSIFVAPGESLSYWALMERVHDSRELLVGYIELTSSAERELDVVINPSGEMRQKKVAWSNRQLKLITIDRREDVVDVPEEGAAAADTKQGTDRTRNEMAMAMQLARSMPKRRRGAAAGAASIEEPPPPSTPQQPPAGSPAGDEKPAPARKGESELDRALRVVRKMNRKKSGGEPSVPVATNGAAEPPAQPDELVR